MNLEGKNIGFAFTGSFCTFRKTIDEMKKEALAIVQSYTTEFVDKIRSKGKITVEDYDSYIQKLENRINYIKKDGIIESMNFKM